MLRRVNYSHTWGCSSANRAPAEAQDLHHGEFVAIALLFESDGTWRSVRRPLNARKLTGFLLPALIQLSREDIVRGFMDVIGRRRFLDVRWIRA